MREKILESYTNRKLKDTMELFFGRGSRVEIKKIFHLSQMKTEQVEVMVWITDPEVTVTYWPQNIEWLLQESWEFVNGKNTQCIIQASYDIIL
jgi:hypothetical protein